MTSSRLFRSYAIAVLATVLALLLKLQLGPALNRSAFSTYYLAVVFSAWYGGFGPGMLSTLASAAVTAFLFQGQASANGDQIPAVGVVLFVITGTLITGTIAYLQKLRRELESRMQERTTELSSANRRLQHAEERFRSAFDHAPIGMALVSVDGRLLRVNDALCRIFGYTQEELLSMPVWAVTHPDDMPATIEQLQRLIEGESLEWELEKRFLHKDGHIVWGASRTSVVRDGAGRVQYVVSQLQDITARKQAEVALRQSEERFRALVEHAFDAVSLFAADGTLLYTTPNSSRIFGRSVEAALGRNMLEFTHPDDQALCLNAFAEILQKPGQTMVGQFRQLHENGSWLWLEATVRNLLDMPGVGAIVANYHDITERKHAEEMLRQAHAITERHAHEMTMVSDILRALNAEIDVATAYPSVARGVHMLTECSRSALGMFDAQRKSVTIVALDQMEGPFTPGIQLQMTDFPGAPEVLAGEPHVVRDLEAECESPVIQRVYNDGFRSGLGVPLRGTKGVMGMLILLWQRQGGPNLAQLPLMRQIADAVALAAEKSNLFEEVRVKTERLQALSQRLMEVQEEERRHIARELHDEIGQLLTGLKLLLDSVGRLPPEGTVARLGKAQECVEDLIGRVRDLSLDLRPAMLDDLGLLPALLWLFGRYSAQTAVRVSFEHKGLEQRLEQEVTTAAYRIVQEALTNVARYAGVNEVAVRAWTEDGSLKLQVVDHGAGFDADGEPDGRRTSGLAGMRERALLLGGRLTVNSAAGNGTRINAELPFGRRP